MRRLARVVIVDPTVVEDLESCLSTARAWRDRKCGRERLWADCMVRVSHAIRLLADIVVALRSYRSVVGGARMRELVKRCRERYNGVWGSRRKVVSVRMPVEVYEALREVAARRGCTVSDVIREALGRYVFSRG